jgi:spindle assembly abnormal protein 6
VGADGVMDSSLGVVETNKFKHLSHISLRFKPGDDGAIKQYLAGRLMDVRGERDKWRAAHGEASSELSAASTGLEAASAELTAEKDAAARVEKSTRARLDELSATLKKSAMEELENTKVGLCQVESSSCPVA